MLSTAVYCYGISMFKQMISLIPYGCYGMVPRELLNYLKKVSFMCVINVNRYEMLLCIRLYVNQNMIITFVSNFLVN